MYSDIPVPEKMIEITDFQVLTGDSVSIGDTIAVLLDFRAIIDCDVMVSLPIFGGIRLLNDTTRNFQYSQNISVEKDSIESLTFYLIASDSGTTYIKAAVAIIPNDSYVRFPQNFSGMDESPHYEIDIGTPDISYLMICKNFIPNQDIVCQNLYFGQLVLNVGTEELSPVRRNVNVNGKILFHDYYEPFAPNEAREKGALTNVWLFFYKSNLNVSLYHPVPYHNGKPIEGVHFARCNEQGGFGFAFDYLLDSLILSDPSANWKIGLFVGKENEAVLLNSMNKHHLIHNIVNPDRDSDELKVFQIRINPDLNNQFSSTANYTWHLGKRYFGSFGSTNEEGAIFRHTTLSRKFLIERLEIDENDENQMMKNIPNQVTIQEEYHSSAYNRYSGNTIYIVHRGEDNDKRTRPTSGLMAHEWAHYYHSNILGWKGSDVISEGWAIFFANAFMNWQENKYSDRRDYIDDCEMGPFCNYLASFSYEKDGDTIHHLDQNIRFGNISKTNYNKGSGNIGFEMSRFACYLWNIYDSYQEENYKRPAYEGYENDDVHGLGKDVFDCFIYYNQNYESLPSSTRNIPEGFNDLFKSFVAENDNELQESIQKIYDCMEFGKGLDIYHHTVKMPPPPVEIVTFHQDGQLSYVDVKTTTYPASFGNLNKRWTSSLDTTYHIVANFSNIEDGVQVDFEHESEWQFKNYVSSSSNPYRALLNRIQPTKYKLSTYSSIWDKSKNPPEPSIFMSYGEKPEFEVFKIGINNSSDISFDDLIYPNPNKGILNIKSPRLTEGILTINVYDINGVRVHTETSKAINKEIIIYMPSNVTNGVYYFEVIDVIHNTILTNNSFIINN